MSNTGDNGQALNTLQIARSPISGPDMVWESGSGKAFHFVAQSTAMAIQDATDNLRNVSTISTTAIGVAMAQMMSSGDVQTWTPVIQAAQALVQVGAADFRAIGENAADILRRFPRGERATEGTRPADDSSRR